MLPLGTVAPDFLLPDTNGKLVSLAVFRKAPALLVIFLCNHCPYVQHIRAGLVQVASDLQRQGVAVVGINSNDAAAYPEDGPAGMKNEVRKAGYTFPYLFDVDQSIARSYRAACTPEFYLFDQDRRLVYRGQMDDSRPGNAVSVSGADLRAAVDAVLKRQPVAGPQKPSVGCNIKWKEGNEPDYYKR